jgi:hypothetical protein
VDGLGKSALLFTPVWHALGDRPSVHKSTTLKHAVIQVGIPKMKLAGILMLGLAITMITVGRPRDGHVVTWLCSEFRQQAYGFAFTILLFLGSLLVAH